MSDNHTRGRKDVPMPEKAGLNARSNDDDPAAELDLHVAVDDFTRSFTPTDPAAVLDRLRRVPVGGRMTCSGGPASHGNRASVMPKSGLHPPPSGESMPKPVVRMLGSPTGGKTVLAAYLQALAVRPVAHDALVWLVDGCSGTGAHADASDFQAVLDVLNDLTTCLDQASHAPSRSHHTLDQLNKQAVDALPKALWVPAERDSNWWRTACLQTGENDQDLDVLTEIIAGARPFTGQAVAKDVRFTLTTLRTEISRRSRLSRGEAPWVRLLDFTWPSAVVGRSLARLLQYQAPDVAEAWRVWSMGHSIALSRHMPEVWERHTAPRNDISAGAVFVLLSANACRTLTVPAPPAQRRPDPVPRGDQPSAHRHNMPQAADGDCARATVGDEPSSRKWPPLGATAGRRKATGPDPRPHVDQRVDDFLTTITIHGKAGQESRDAREHQRMEPPDMLEPIAPVLDECTVQAIKAYEPGEDTLPDIERLLLSAAS